MGVPRAKERQRRRVPGARLLPLLLDDARRARDRNRFVDAVVVNSGGGRQRVPLCRDGDPKVGLEEEGAALMGCFFIPFYYL